MDDWIKLRQELKKYHLSPLEEKMLPEVISKLRTKGGKLDADTVAAAATAAVRRHVSKMAKKKAMENNQRGRAKRKPGRVKK